MESKRIEFNHDGKVFYYDFNDMQFQHVNSATVLFNLIIEQKANPPKTDRHIEQSGMLDLGIKALGYLLLKEDGKYSYNENVEFLRTISGVENLKKIQEMKSDFFDAASIVDADSLKPYTALIAAFGSLSLEQIQSLASLQQMPLQAGSSENVSSNESSDSISPMSQDEDL